MSEFGKNYDRAASHYDNMEPPDEDSGDCEFESHRRSLGIPLDDEGRETCRDCGVLYFEHEETKRMRKMRE